MTLTAPDAMQTDLETLMQAVRDADSSSALLQATRALAASGHPGGTGLLVEVLAYNNPGAAVASMEQVFRANLAALYRLLQLPAPAALDTPLSHGGGEAELGGAMRRAS